jgi:hypothetical protein
MMKKEISRQRKWQLKMLGLKLCITCGQDKIFKGEKCLTHYTASAIHSRLRRRKKYGQNRWRFGKRGRPPILELRLAYGEKS